MLHVTNGDSAAQSMRQAGLPGQVIAWSDVLYEGPTPAEHGPLWRETRAKHLSASGYSTFESILRSYERADATLAQYPDHDELVLWFEHDLFDQLLLARHLHWLGTCGPAATRLSLICIDAFPGVEPFHGLGQLTPAQLGSLFPLRHPISRAQINTGSDVWRAFTSDDPRPLNLIVQQGTPDLPFMPGALTRYLEEFPGARDGLSRTERTVLLETRRAPRTAKDLFLALQRQEERVFMGDATFWRILREMATGPSPLLEAVQDEGTEGEAASMERGDRPSLPPQIGETEAVRVSPETSLRISAVGERVLNGEDAVRLRGLDCWRGGAHLTAERTWRWDAQRKGLT